MGTLRPVASSWRSSRCAATPTAVAFASLSSAAVSRSSGSSSSTDDGREQNGAGSRMISLIIPTLNEVGSIGAVIDEARKYVDEIIVVDGGSRDGTKAECARHG